MRLLIGLGNPGEKYEKTRHNVGVMLVERAGEILLPAGRQVGSVQNDKGNAQNDKINWKAVKLKCFMNDSGIEVRQVMNFYKVEPKDLIIVHDDLDIKLGEFKIQHGKGPYGHNGILSIERELGTKEFTRVRIGIENRDPENKVAGVEYTLQNFTSEELIIIEKTFDQIFSQLPPILSVST